MSASPPVPGAPSSVGLDQLARHAVATVVGMQAPAAEHDRELVLRLLEIGFLPGERVRVIAHGYPGGEPVAVRLGHTTFALRRHEAAFIRVVPEGRPA
ncbi:FeoA family protein [Variovorax terrae]|uniref:Ferrous iron transport protein A n=1 Tax=Variovorax terrae TaxID=2923278 RepID=A0A9X1VYA7_9BURK|nr:FeoA family protein [Variovorax terrae]MCJ0764237.1 ferrous iron transport protein A [Variovorax terrae]